MLFRNLSKVKIVTALFNELVYTEKHVKMKQNRKGRVIHENRLYSIKCRLWESG